MKRVELLGPFGMEDIKEDEEEEEKKRGFLAVKEKLQGEGNERENEGQVQEVWLDN